jgi:hypothetical protein
VRLFVISREAALRLVADGERTSPEAEDYMALGGALDAFDAAALCEGSCLLLELKNSRPSNDIEISCRSKTPNSNELSATILQTTTWSDSLLYTFKGQAHSAWQLLPRSHIAPLTAEAQEFLMAWQFPVNGCSGAKFLVSHGNSIHGLGSILHVATSHLSIAIEQGRIFVWNEGVGDIYADEESCPGSVSLECFFRAPSSCTIKDARVPGTDTIDCEVYNAAERYGLSTFHVPAAMKAMWANHSAGVDARPAPLAMALKYWWRAQAVAFLARFNDKTTTALYDLRTNASAIIYSLGAGVAPLHPSHNLVGPGWPPAAELNTGTQLAASFPFKRGMTSIHVRHGDKAAEMTLIPNEAYFAAAESLVMHHPMGLMRAAFISTEDPGTLIAAANERRGWAMMWYDVPRHNSNGAQQLNTLPVPRTVLTRIWFLQLLMALECDAWIGTRGSNWNR